MCILYVTDQHRRAIARVKQLHADGCHGNDGARQYEGDDESNGHWLKLGVIFCNQTSGCWIKSSMMKSDFLLLVVGNLHPVASTIFGSVKHLIGLVDHQHLVSFAISLHHTDANTNRHSDHPC